MATVQEEVKSYFDSHKDEFKGDQGDKGNRGNRGERGDSGPVGDEGPRGPRGYTGFMGDTGNGIDSTEVTYQVGTSGQTVPTGEWLLAIPAVPKGQFLWTKTVFKYLDRTTATAYTSAYQGLDGVEGKGILSAVVTYQVGTSATAIPTGAWSTNIPATSTGQFLWGRTVTTFTDGTISIVYSVSAHGAKGDTGPKGDTGAKGDKGDKGDPGDIKNKYKTWTTTSVYNNYPFICNGTTGVQSTQTQSFFTVMQLENESVYTNDPGRALVNFEIQCLLSASITVNYLSINGQMLVDYLIEALGNEHPYNYAHNVNGALTEIVCLPTASTPSIYYATQIQNPTGSSKVPIYNSTSVETTKQALYLRMSPASNPSLPTGSTVMVKGILVIKKAFTTVGMG